MARDLALAEDEGLLAWAVVSATAIRPLSAPRQGCRHLLPAAIRRDDLPRRQGWIPIHVARCFDQLSQPGSGVGVLFFPPSSVEVALTHSSNDLVRRVGAPGPTLRDQLWWRGSGRVGRDGTNSPETAPVFGCARFHHRPKQDVLPGC